MNSSQWHNLFWCKDEPRLRAGWRLLIQMLMAGFLLLLEIFAFAFANLWLHWHLSDIGLLIVGTFFQLVAITGSILIARRWLDHRPFLELGLHPDSDTALDILRGLSMASIMLLIPFTVLYSLGWLQITGHGQDYGQALLYLLLFVVIGFQEELLCRGYILRTIQSGSSLFPAVWYSAFIFAILHGFNPGANGQAMLGIFAAGLLLGWAAVRTGKLWLSIGIHIGWNFFEGVVFGFPTSGIAIYSLTHIHVTGPLLWTGGSFGPEAGLIILPTLTIGVGMVWWYTNGWKFF